jgi:hypothetical protein
VEEPVHGVPKKSSEDAAEKRGNLFEKVSEDFAALVSCPALNRFINYITPWGISKGRSRWGPGNTLIKPEG